MWWSIALTTILVILIIAVRFEMLTSELEASKSQNEMLASELETAERQFESELETAEKKFEVEEKQKNELASKLETAEKKIDLSETISSLKTQIGNLKDELVILKMETLVESSKFYNQLEEDITSDEIKNKLALLHIEQEECIKSNNYIKILGYQDKKVLDKQQKQILRCFNAEILHILSSVSLKNVDTMRSKALSSFMYINKIFEVDKVQISQQYFDLKLQELALIYSYQLKKQEEAEQRKAIKEQMVEEEKMRREIEQRKLKIEKEKQHFSQETSKLMAYLQTARDEAERALYINKIQELESKLKEIDAEQERIFEQEQNIRSGFVYIISNIGSFGENVYKIGMTRRLEPMDRINELSSASVPFPFDVHAVIFSHDAPGLETTLHQYFRDKQVNKVNNRKEFFKVNLDEIKDVVLKNHNATVQFIDIPEALEYRETLKITESE